MHRRASTRRVTVALAVIVSADRYYLEIQYNVYRDIPAFRFPVGHDVYTATYVTDVHRNGASCQTWIMPTFITAISITVEMKRSVIVYVKQTYSHRQNY